MTDSIVSPMQINMGCKLARLDPVEVSKPSG
jgi:hypothetical protein